MRAWNTSARSLGAALVLAALPVTLAAPREASAAEAALKSALSDYGSGLKDGALKKVKAYLATEPPDAEIAKVLAATDDALEKKIIALRGEHEEAMVELQTRARIAVKTQECLDLSFRWLASHQAATGEWEAEGFGRWCDGVEGDSPVGSGDGKGQYVYGVTALSLLAFLEAGFTLKEVHPYAAVIAKGLAWLRGVQAADGGIGDRRVGHWVYDHGVSVLALVEAYRRTGSEDLVEPARRGLALLVEAQNPGSGWRYGIKPGESDSSLTAWSMLAFEAAKKVNDADVKAGKPPTFPYPPEVAKGIRTWFVSMTDTFTGEGGYKERGTGSARPPESVDAFPAEFTESATAAGLCARCFLGEDPAKNDTMAKQIARVVKCPPAWAQRPGGVDFYYWRYGTHALSQVRGAPWRTWRKALVDAVADKQRRDGTSCVFRGSWDPVDVWGADGGRVYATAIVSLSLAMATPFDHKKPSPPVVKVK